jgi:hypothetical protein
MTGAQESVSDFMSHGMAENHGFCHARLDGQKLHAREEDESIAILGESQDVGRQYPTFHFTLRQNLHNDSGNIQGQSTARGILELSLSE